MQPLATNALLQEGGFHEYSRLNQSIKQFGMWLKIIMVVVV
jgi:hypothetical protein